MPTSRHGHQGVRACQGRGGEDRQHEVSPAQERLRSRGADKIRPEILSSEELERFKAAAAARATATASELLQRLGEGHILSDDELVKLRESTLTTASRTEAVIAARVLLDGDEHTMSPAPSNELTPPLQTTVPLASAAAATAPAAAAPAAAAGAAAIAGLAPHHVAGSMTPASAAVLIGSTAHGALAGPV